MMAGKILGELVEIETADRLGLTGFYVPKARSRKGAVFIHGLCSGMRAGRKFESIARVAGSAGFQFLTFGNRGSGMVNGFSKNTKKSGYKIAGGSMEDFRECRIDIQAAVNFLKKKGCRKIVLIGSSTGCQKSIYYLTRRPDRSVKGLILMAPVNDTEGEIASRGLPEFKKLFKKAKSLTEKGKGDTLLTHLSAKRFYDLHKPRSLEASMLDFGRKRMARISKIRVPILALLGDADPYVTPGKHKERLEKIKGSSNRKAGCETALINDGDHGFKDALPAVSRTIRDWLRRL